MENNCGIEENIFFNLRQGLFKEDFFIYVKYVFIEVKFCLFSCHHIIMKVEGHLIYVVVPLTLGVTYMCVITLLL